jgi:hypothetical protein
MSKQQSMLKAIGLSVFLAWVAFGLIGFIGEYVWPEGPGILIVAAIVCIPVGVFVFLKTYRGPA